MHYLLILQIFIKKKVKFSETAVTPPVQKTVVHLPIFIPLTPQRFPMVPTANINSKVARQRIFFYYILLKFHLW